MAKVSVNQSFDASALVSKRVVTGATDNTMVYGMLVWASALTRTASKPFHLVLAYFEGTLSQRRIETIEAVLAELGQAHSFLELQTDERFVAQGHISPTTFAKFLIADAIPSPHLWIDVDTVAAEGWDDLFAVVSKEAPKYDLVVAERGDRKRNPESTAVIAPSDLPFNAGVLGWPASARRDWASQLGQVGAVPTIEQFVFNTLYAESCHRVPESFNTLTYRIDSLRGGTVPQIIHYAGAHKPWHLPRRFTNLCKTHECPWSHWFRAEEAFLRAIANTAIAGEVLDIQARALRSPTLRWQRDHSGVILLRLLTAIGPLGWLVVLAAKPLSRWIPRGTHPLH